MEHECSLPWSQVSTNGTYPEADESGLYPSPIFLRSILILSSHVRIGIPRDLPIRF
jgi:hypothetical protein